jgi:hypothetical protein
MRPPYSGVVDQRGAAGGNPVVLGRKFCSGCGRWRQVNDFPRVRRRVGGGLRARCWACHRRYQRELHRNSTPEQRALRREYGRFWLEAERRRNGTPEREFKRKRAVVDQPERIFLDRKPLVEAMNRYAKREIASGRDGGNGMPDLWKALAREAGLQPRALHRLRTGESKRVRIDIADKIAVALDTPLALLYPP